MNRSVTLGRPWTTDEDDKLINAVRIHGDNTEKWKIIAQAVPGRTNKACRKRWLHSLCPTVKKCAWSPEEDQLLLSLFEKSPNKWSQIARGIPGRTDDACSKRYREALDPNLKKGDWTTDEDYHLLDALLRQDDPAHPKWGTIGQELQRSGLACRNRWRLLERKKATEGRKASVHNSPTSAGLLPFSHGAPTEWPGMDVNGSGFWSGHWGVNAMGSSDFSNIDQALEHFVRQQVMTESSGSSSVRTAADEQGMSFEPLNDAWMTSSHHAGSLHPGLMRRTENFVQSHSHESFSIDPSLDPGLSDYNPTGPDASTTDLSQDFGAMQADFGLDMPFQTTEQDRPTSTGHSSHSEPQSSSSIEPHTQHHPEHSPPSIQQDVDLSLNRLGALADAASALSPTPCPVQMDAPLEISAGPSRKRKRNIPDPAMTANLSIMDIGLQKPSPKLSSSLPVAGDPTILAYACGHTSCWPGSTHASVARYATSGELLSHFKDIHMNKPGVTDETPFKCGLQGCSKGWKSINGLQYHLQIAKAHYQNVMFMVTTDVFNTPAPLNTASAAADDQLQTKYEKSHKCPHAGCPKEYKQLSGLRYHLLHGHPKTVPVQLETLPPSMVKKLGLESRSQVLRA